MNIKYELLKYSPAVKVRTGRCLYFKYPLQSIFIISLAAKHDECG